MPHHNLWQATAGERLNAPVLNGEQRVDLAIVGAGFTGCAAALRAAERGLRVALLEAHSVGHGGAGRNVGLVNAGLWLPPDVVCEQLGQRVGERLNRALAEGPARVFDCIERLQIDCQATRRGTLHCANNAAGVKKLRQRLAQQQARGAPVHLLGREQTRQLTGSPGFEAALLDQRAGTVQPLDYVLGLARAARQLGAQLFEQSPLLSARHDGQHWRLQSTEGRVLAPALIVATHAYHQGLPLPAALHYTPVHYCQGATAPLGDEVWHELLPECQGCWDTATVMSSFRRDAEGRLIVGGMGDLEAFGAGVHRRWLKRKLRQLFPQLSDLPLQHQWHGRIAMTADHIPKLVQLGDRAAMVAGYSGRGIAPGTVFGLALADWVADGQSEHLPLPLCRAHTERFCTAKQQLYEFGATAAHLWA